MLHVRDVQELDQQLLHVSAASTLRIDDVMRAAWEWFDRVQPFHILNRQTLAQLCESIRISPTANPDVARLALGALICIQAECQSNPEKARFVTRYALYRISALTNKRQRWGRVLISDDAYREALELFDVARGDAAISDESIFLSTREFIRRFENSPDMFGRLAQDLAHLLQLVVGKRQAIVLDLGQGRQRYARSLAHFLQGPVIAHAQAAKQTAECRLG